MYVLITYLFLPKKLVPQFLALYTKNSMSIATEKKGGFQFIRFITDSVTESDISAIKATVAKVLSEGTKGIVLCVDVGSLSNQLVISRLLLQCSEMVRRKAGRLVFIEDSHNEKSVFRTICDTLHIPHCDSEEKLPMAAATADAAPQ
jgi:hypothetical protein